MAGLNEKDVLDFLRNATPGFIQKATNILNKFPGTRTSLTKLATGGLSEAPEELTRDFQLRQELLKQQGEQALKTANAFQYLEEESRKLFGTTEQAAQAMQSLSSNMNIFNQLNEDTQKNLAHSTMLLNKFGVDADTTSQILDSAAMAFGMSQEKLKGLANELATIVYRFPGQASEIARNFKSAQTNLAYDSEKLMGVFKKLQMTSSTTGISFSTLTDKFGESMDTFQGSASKAGTLNSILGRSVFNAIDLLGKTEAERVDTIIKGVRSSIGGDVNRLGKFQLKAVADGLGLSPEDTRRLLSGQTTAEGLMKDKKDPKTLLQEQANKALNDNTMTIEELTTTFKLYQSPLERIERKLEETTRRAALEKGTKILQDLAEKSGILKKEDARLIKIRDMGEVIEKALMIAAGISPLKDAQSEEALRIRAGQRTGATMEEDAVNKLMKEALTKLSEITSIPGQILKKYGVTTPEPAIIKTPKTGIESDRKTGIESDRKTGIESDRKTNTEASDSSLSKQIGKEITAALQGMKWEISFTNFVNGALKGALKSLGTE